jgi:site-specific DNA-methyltransferase (adenine-specific)
VKTTKNGKSIDRLFRCHSAESMRELPADAVTLTVTSPPYWNAIDYDRHAENSEADYRTRAYAKGFIGYEEYLSLLDRVFGEVLRVTRPGGFCAVVIGTVLDKGRHIPVPFHFTTRMSDLGWEFHQDIIWHKCTAGVKRAGVFIQKPYPGYFYPNIMTEYILLFRKPGERLFSQATAAMKEESRLQVNGLFTKEVANNIWHIAPVPPGQLDHPCPFPEEIPARLVELYSYAGDLVLDPFLGSGQTTKAASHLGRRVAGYDIERRYIDLAKRRLDEASAIRPKQLIAVFDKIDLLAPTQGKSRPGATRHGSGKPRRKVEQDPSVLFDAH